MITVNKPTREEERLNALLSYQILDTTPEKDYDDIVMMATQITNSSIGYVSFIDDKKQWFKSVEGINLEEFPKEHSLCAIAITLPEKSLIVEDLSEDPRFKKHPAVTGSLKIKFYASIALIDPEGYELGSLCVFDKKSKKLSHKQDLALKALARQVVNALEIRKHKLAQKKNLNLLKSKTAAFEKFANETLHEITSPLNSMSLVMDLLEKNILEKNTEKALKYANSIKNSSNSVIKKITDLREKYQFMDLITKEKTRINLTELINGIRENNKLIQKKSEFNFSHDLFVFFENEKLIKTILEPTIENLIAISKKENVKISFYLEKTKEAISIILMDNTGVEAFTYTDNALSYLNDVLSAAKWHYSVVFNEGIGNTIKLTMPK